MRYRAAAALGASVMLLVLNGPVMFPGTVLLGSVAIWTWYGAVRPDQVSQRLAPCRTMAALMKGEGTTVTHMVAAQDQPLLSNRLTVNALVPMSATAGVPERVPSLPTLSQAGPPSLAKRTLSPDGRMELAVSEAA